MAHICIARMTASGRPRRRKRTNALEEWIASLLPRFHTRHALAEAAGVSDSAFSRQVATGTLGLVPLLRLAQATGESASVVLRLARKHQLADLIEASFGAPRVATRLALELAEATASPLPEAVAWRHVEILKGIRADAIAQRELLDAERAENAELRRRLEAQRGTAAGPRLVAAPDTPDTIQPSSERTAADPHETPQTPHA